jgi:hypothetical protein
MAVPSFSPLRNKWLFVNILQRKSQLLSRLIGFFGSGVQYAGTSRPVFLCFRLPRVFFLLTTFPCLLSQRFQVWVWVVRYSAGGFRLGQRVGRIALTSSSSQKKDYDVIILGRCHVTPINFTEALRGIKCFVGIWLHEYMPLDIVCRNSSAFTLGFGNITRYTCKVYVAVMKLITRCWREVLEMHHPGEFYWILLSIAHTRACSKVSCIDACRSPTRIETPRTAVHWLLFKACQSASPEGSDTTLCHINRTTKYKKYSCCDFLMTEGKISIEIDCYHVFSFWTDVPSPGFC